MASYKKSRDQLQLGWIWVQATILITIHFIHSWGDRQLRFQRYGADPAYKVKTKLGVIQKGYPFFG